MHTLQRNSSGNIALTYPYIKVIIYPGLIVSDDQILNFEKWVNYEFNTRVRYLEQIVTGVSIIGGCTYPLTAGRNDILMAVHEDDISSASAPHRLSRGMRWLHDVIEIEARKNQSMYPARIDEYEKQYENLKI